MSDRRAWSVTFASQAEAVRALRRLRGRWGSRAKDHWAVEAGKFALVLGAAVLAILDVIRLESLLAFLLGLAALNLFFRHIKPRLQARFGPAEFGQAANPTVRIAEDGLHLESDSSRSWLAWDRVPPPRVSACGLVFRVGPEHAVPFPTDGLDEEPEAIAEVIRGWKEAGRA